MENMNGKVMDTAEKMARGLFCLSDDYRVLSCNVKPNEVEIGMGNGLISMKVKIPASLVDENITYEEEIAENEAEQENIEEEEASDNEEEEIVLQKSVKNVKRKAPVRK